MVSVTLMPQVSWNIRSVDQVGGDKVPSIVGGSWPFAHSPAYTLMMSSFSCAF